MKLSCLKNKLFLLLLILLLAFCIRIYHLNAENLDLAEAYRFTEADSLDGAFYKTLNYEEHPPAYNIFLYFWRFLGENVFILRLSSVLLGLGMIAVIYFLGKNIFNERTGLLAALLLALNPLHLDYSQNLEPYTFIAFFSFLAIYFLVRALESNIFWYWFGFVVSVLIAGYADHFILFLLIAIVLAIILTYKEQKSKVKNLLISGIVMSVLFIPNIFIGLFQFDFFSNVGSAINLIHPLWYFLIIPYNLMTLVVGMRTIFFNSAYFPVLNLIVPLLFIALFFGFFFLKGFFSFKEDNGRHEKKILLLSCFLVPILSIYLMSFFVYMMISPNRILFCSFTFFLLVAKGIDSIKRRNIFAGVLILLLLISSLLVYSYYQQHKTNIEPIAVSIRENYQRGDVVAVVPQQYFPTLRYYLPKDFPVTSFPVHFWIDTTVKYQRANFNLEIIDNQTIPLLLNYQKELSKKYERLWYVVELKRGEAVDKNNYILTNLLINYDLISSKKSPDGKVGLYLFKLQ